MLCSPPNKNELNIPGNVYPLFFVSIDKCEAKIYYQSLSYGNLKQYSLDRG